jgi:hypothetical protein
MDQGCIAAFTGGVLSFQFAPLSQAGLFFCAAAQDSDSPATGMWVGCERAFPSQEAHDVHITSPAFLGGAFFGHGASPSG